MGKIFKKYIKKVGIQHIYVCIRCKTHLSTNNEIISRAFRGQHGQAYLFNKVINVMENDTVQDREMLTGLHKIRDVRCKDCSAVIGWKYEFSFEPSQKYKEGKYVLERVLVSTEDGSLDDDNGDGDDGDI